MKVMIVSCLSSDVFLLFQGMHCVIQKVLVNIMMDSL